MTSTTSAEEEIQNQPRRRRARTAPEKRDALIREWKNSGMSATAFARSAGIEYSTFKNWARRQHTAASPGPETSKLAIECDTEPVRRRGGNAITHSKMRLIEALVEEKRVLRNAPEQECVCIELPGGARMPLINGAQADLAADVLYALARRQSYPPTAKTPLMPC